MKKLFLKEKWNAFRGKCTKLWQNILKIVDQLNRLLIYMKGQVKRQLPGWKKDAHDFQEEIHDAIDDRRTRFRKQRKEWRTILSSVDASPEKLHQMLFEDRTKIGKLFESIIITLIIASVLVVMLDSVESIHRHFGFVLVSLEWIFTIVFTIEYLLRIYSSRQPIRYVISFFGLIDLITVLPTYIGIFFPQAHTFLILRVLRVIRIFRLLKLVKMMKAGSTITASLRASKEKIVVFLIFVLLIVTVMGSMLYIVEAGQDSGFTSIPASVYWAIVTLTTVGYGDIAPSTWLGQLIAASVMITGYAVIAVPTGIVSAEFAHQRKKASKSRILCDRCGKNTHEKKARYCSRCGDRLLIEEPG